MSRWMLARPLALLLALVALAAPVASAFAATTGPVHIAYALDGAPVLLASGKLTAAGDLTGGFVAIAIKEGRFGPAPTLSIGEAANGTSLPKLENVSGGTLVVHNGNLLWKLDNATAVLSASADYAFGLALGSSPFDPKGPDGSDNASRNPALVMAGPAIGATVRWSTGDALLVPVQATVSVLDASGAPVSGWDHRVVNPTASIANAEQDHSGAVAFRASGAFDATIPSQGIAGGLDGRSGTMRLGVVASGNDAFQQAAEAVTNATNAFAGASGDQGAGSPDLAQALGPLAGVSPIFNGAVLIVPGGGGGDDSKSGNATKQPTPTDASLGGEALDVGPFAFLRADDLALVWGDGTVGVAGTQKATVTQSGFAVQPPLVVGYVPLISALLWLVAIGSIVWFFVKRPPASKGKWSLRGIGWGVYALVFLVVFFFWDRSFAATFGTSLITLLKANGFQNYTQLGLVFGIEMVPWGLATLLFALPVRIALGVALRYRGEGSSFKGIAKAGGLVSLGILGPLYALWIVNVLIAGMLAFAPKLFGGGG